MVAGVSSAEPAATSLGPEAPIFELMRNVRAMRRLKPDPVPRELLEQLVQAATWGPSASNVQAYTFVVVTDRDKLRALAEPWMACIALLPRERRAPGGHDPGPLRSHASPPLGIRPSTSRRSPR